MRNIGVRNAPCWDPNVLNASCTNCYCERVFASSAILQLTLPVRGLEQWKNSFRGIQTFAQARTKNVFNSVHVVNPCSSTLIEEHCGPRNTHSNQTSSTFLPFYPVDVLIFLGGLHDRTPISLVQYSAENRTGCSIFTGPSSCIPQNNFQVIYIRGRGSFSSPFRWSCLISRIGIEGESGANKIGGTGTGNRSIIFISTPSAVV